MVGQLTRGAFIVLVGPDGVGKTTLAIEVMEQWGIDNARYFHFVPTGEWIRPQAGEVKQHTPSPSTALSLIRLLRNVGRVWIAHVRWIRPAVRSGCLVVGDRWLYSYLLDPESVRYGGSPRLIRLILRFLPSPDAVVALRASAERIRSRKAELDTEEIRRQLDALADLPGPITILDADETPARLGQRVLALISR